MSLLDEGLKARVIRVSNGSGCLVPASRVNLSVLEGARRLKYLMAKRSP
jgi:hypothetical protein